MKQIIKTILLSTLLFYLHFASAQAFASTNSNICYVVSYDHGGVILWGYDHFLETFRELQTWFDRHPKLKMGLDNEAWAYDWLAENQPSVLAEIKDALRKYRGRLGIGSCNYGQPLAGFIVDESNIRQVTMAVETVKKRLGYDLKIYSWSEHAGFPQLAQILASAGFEGVLNRTHFMMYGFCPGYDYPIVLWEAPDGSKIPCVPTYVHQERQLPNYLAQPPGPYGLTTEDTWILTRYPSKESPAPLDSFVKRFSHIKPVVASRIDDTRLKREELVSELDPRSDYEWTTLEDLFKKMPEPTQVVSPKCDDFAYRMPWGYRGNELFNLYRRAEVSVLTAERLAARLFYDYKFDGKSLIKGKIDADTFREYEKQLDGAWKNLLVAQHHDVQITYPPGPLGRELILSTIDKSRSVVKECFEHIVSNTDAEKGCFTAFNPLPWKRTEVSVQLAGGHIVEKEVEIPAFGFATFKTLPSQPTQITNLFFTTKYYKVAFSPSGGIEELTTTDGRRIFKPGVKSGILSGIINTNEFTSEGKVAVRKSSTGYLVEERGNISSIRYTIRWFFPMNKNRIECSIKARFTGEKIGTPAKNPRDSFSCFTHEKKLRLILHPDIDTANAFGLHDFPFSIDSTTNKYIEGNYWTAVGDKSGGIAIVNQGTMCSVREDNGALSVPLAFSTEYIWGMEMLVGEKEWSLAIIPWQGNWKDAHIHRQALEYAFPIIGAPGSIAKQTGDFLNLEDHDLFITALYTRDLNLYARFFNCSATPKPLSIEKKLIGKLRPVNLLHQSVDTPKEDALKLNKWQFKTYQIR
ncbi:MAG: hypothetical protein N2487_03670 [Verrucomicrobiae bacterium]|nr:hypothetical protein [Verrucomicrobiae bacterium]